MRDFPNFQTEYGTAGLVLNQIPYTGSAYIHIYQCSDIEGLLNECVSFCVACGAGKVFAAGDVLNVDDVQPIRVLIMKCDVSDIPDTDACLMPVTETTLERWLEIYRERMRDVDNAAYISKKEGLQMLAEGGAYFIHKNNVLLGIGKISGDHIDCVASVVKGCGADIMAAICHALPGNVVSLEVASTNLAALRLYERMGFVTVGVKYEWYQIL